MDTDSGDISQHKISPGEETAMQHTTTAIGEGG